MAFQRPQRSEGGGGAGHSPAIALPLGARGARVQRFEQRGKVRSAASKNWRRRTDACAQENAKLLEQREVLKKSLGILSEAPPSGMPGSNR